MIVLLIGRPSDLHVPWPEPRGCNQACEGLAPIQGKNTVVGATETRIMESVRLSATVSHEIRTRLASLASLGTFVTKRGPAPIRASSVKHLPAVPGQVPTNRPSTSLPLTRESPTGIPSVSRRLNQRY
jgi:hypothetical protein